MKKGILFMLVLVLTLTTALPFSASSVYDADPGFLGGRDLIEIRSASEFTEFYSMGMYEQLEYVGTNIVKLENVRYGNKDNYEQLYTDVMNGDATSGEEDLTFLGNSIYDGSESINRLRVVYKGESISNEVEEIETGFFGGEPEITFYDKNEFTDFYLMSFEEQLNFLGTDIVGLEDVRYFDDYAYERLYSQVQNDEVYEGEAEITYIGNSVYDGSEKTKQLNVIYRGEKDEDNDEVSGFMYGRDEITIYSLNEFFDLPNFSINEQLEYLGITPIGLDNLRYGNLDEYNDLVSQIENGAKSGQATITFIGNSIYDGSETSRDVLLSVEVE